jgi:hypothetical protein
LIILRFGLSDDAEVGEVDVGRQGGDDADVGLQGDDAGRHCVNWLKVISAAAAEKGLSVHAFVSPAFREIDDISLA